MKVDEYLVERLIHKEGVRRVIYEEDLKRFVKDLLESAVDSARLEVENKLYLSPLKIINVSGESPIVFINKESILNTLEL